MPRRAVNRMLLAGLLVFGVVILGVLFVAVLIGLTQIDQLEAALIANPELLDRLNSADTERLAAWMTNPLAIVGAFLSIMTIGFLMGMFIVRLTTPPAPTTTEHSAD